MLARRLLLAFAVALVISATATWLLSRRLRVHAATIPQLQYISLNRDVDAGEVLKPTDLGTVAWPANHRIPDAFLQQDQVAGRVALFHLSAAQPLTSHQLSNIGGGFGLAARIPDGMRAISLKSDQVVGVAGFLLPGTHIDVLVTYKNPSGTDAVTATVLQNAQVLAAGQKTQPDPEGKATSVDVVTLLVSPQEAERVALASTQGSVHFVLRNGADHADQPQPPTRIDALGFSSAAAPAPRVRTISDSPARHHTAEAPAPARHTVIVTRGDKQTVESF